MSLPSAYIAAEIQAASGLLVLTPIHYVVHHLGKGLLGALAHLVIEVVERVALHALGQTTARPEGRHAGVAARDLPLALIVLLLAFGGAGVVIPLAGLAVLTLEGWRELDPLGRQLPAAVRADL